MTLKREREHMLSNAEVMEQGRAGRNQKMNLNVKWNILYLYQKEQQKELKRLGRGQQVTWIDAPFEHLGPPLGWGHQQPQPISWLETAGQATDVPYTIC